ncbi:protein JINGUBANG-like [Iris pallida]|uniref:Protein JINGUBANG-like n=1 Tax=Iris pallida TaxID=29817 RepID=A0AAX6ERP5_IRIPA|nr:protein JINGUBANG-like [Iris pallida]
MPQPDRVAAVAPHLDVLARVDGALEEVPQPGERADPLVLGGVLVGDAPHPYLPVLVAGEDLLAGEHDGLHEAAAGLEPGELGPVLPDPDVPAVGPRVEEVPVGRQGVEVPVLADERAEQARAPVLGHRRDGRGALLPRRLHERGRQSGVPGGRVVGGARVRARPRRHLLVAGRSRSRRT